MFERYSENARKVFSIAKQEAQKLRHDHIGTEHLLLGLIEVKQGFAAEILKKENVDLPHTRKLVQEMVTHGQGPEDADYSFLPRTQHAQTVFDDAVKEGEDLVELTTEKTSFNLPSPTSGTVKQVSVSEGDKIKVGQTLAVIE